MSANALQQNAAIEDELVSELRQELLRRLKKNPRYSLRSFAKFLKLEPAFLSKILNGQRRVGAKTRQRILDSLPQLLLSKPTTLRFHPLAEDQFRLISRWQHYAILELLRISRFKATEQNISKALGITMLETKDACLRLARLGAIACNAQREWESAGQEFTTLSTESSSSAFRELQRDILQKALDALEDFPIEIRDQTSMTMAIDPQSLPQAKLKLKEFRRNFSRWIESQGAPKEVYHLSLSLYPVTQISRSNKNRRKI